MKEEEIRPKELFQKYLELSNKDAKLFDKKLFRKTDCVACGSNQLENKFIKNGFSYQICRNCGSLFCNPRPTQDMLDNFYRNSVSSKFWFEKFLPFVEETRRDKLFRKKAIGLKKITDKNKINVSALCDCGAGSGIFLEELSKIFNNVKFSAIEPGKSSSKILRKKGIETLEKNVEDAKEWYNKFDFVVSLEVFEHVQSPEKFVHSIYELLKYKGYCLVTSLGYEGFDILTLGEKSNSISPPHHLNFLSINGFKKLFYGVGFSEVMISTPGILDVDIVINNSKCPEFLKVLSKRGDKALEDLQNIFIKHRLSSHVWVLAKK